MGGNTVCNHETMATCYLALIAITQELNTAYTKVVDLCSELETSYEGDAKAEINMFLVNLSRHIYRLALFYSKMASFVTLTSQSLKNSDNKMVENIEG